MLTNLTEARPLIRIEMIVKAHTCGQLISGLVDGAATLNFVFEDFVRRLSLEVYKSKVQTHARLANGHM
jgi:inhibitor of KinA sporulation pathway (predicted exonuclease)